MRSLDDQVLDLEVRQLVREVMASYIDSIEDGVVREIALWMHHERISERAADADIHQFLQSADMQAIRALYGERAWVAAVRGRAQGNYSALRCFLREVKRARAALVH